MAYIKGISYYLPERVMDNGELVNEFPEWSVDKVAKKVGVYSRHLSASNETAGDMAEKAACRLFDEYNITPQDIDFVIRVPIISCLQQPVCFNTDLAFLYRQELLIIIWVVPAVSMAWL